jgi:hypothetical protein
MEPTNIANYHVSYPDVYRHWSSQCEQYAGGDALLTLLRSDWEISGALYYEEHWLAGMRLVTVYHVLLTRGEETMSIPVISNPFVRRMIRLENLPVRPLAERQTRRAAGDSVSVN